MRGGEELTVDSDEYEWDRSVGYDGAAAEEALLLVEKSRRPMLRHVPLPLVVVF